MRTASRALPIALLLALLLAAAGAAQADRDDDDEDDDDRDDRKDRADAKRGKERADPKPEPRRDLPPGLKRALEERAAVPASAPAFSLPPSHARPEARTPTPPTPPAEASVDTIAVAGGARVPSWKGDVAPGDGDASAARAWSYMLWTLPLSGLALGAVLLARRRPSAASAAASTAIPEDLKGLLLHGQAATKRGALDEAILCFERALRLAPGLAVAHFCRGVCLAAAGRASDAYGALRAACDAKPDDPGYQVHLARAAVALGKHKEAMDALAIVTRGVPEMGPTLMQDEALAALRDHPRFLMLCGAL